MGDSLKTLVTEAIAADTQSRHNDQEELLASSLRQLLGAIDPQALAMLRAELRWIELPAGQALMQQGEPGDAMYIAISGRLRAEVCDAAGRPIRMREMARGQVIGEMSLYTEEPRSATVVALRDSVLVRLDKEAFQRLLAGGGPVSHALSTALTRQLVRRLQQEGNNPNSQPARPISMCLLAASETPAVDLRSFATLLAQAMGAVHLGGQPARVRLVDALAVDTALAQPGLAQQPLDDIQASRRITLWLDHVEAQCDFLILLADSPAATPGGAPASPWTQRCRRHGDERLILVDAALPPASLPSLRTSLQTFSQASPQTSPQTSPPPTPNPAAATATTTATTTAATAAATDGKTEVLLLLHPAQISMPRHTADWLALHPGAEVLHLRQGHGGDMARVARIQTRQAIGLVLAGGGARGLAHLGVWRALTERGIEVDVIGGTSIGAGMAGLMACDRPVAEVLDVARRVFSTNPTSDYNWLPLLSLIQGKRMKKVIDGAMQELAGANVDIEDLWKPFFCVAANYTRACEQVLQRGPLAKLVRASLSIPGALPPVVISGELYCDGGTFNNFPVDVMRGMRGVGRVIGVNLNVRKPRLYDFDEVPGTWALMRDRLRPHAKRRYRLPSLTAYLMNVTILYSVSRQDQAGSLADLTFNPPLERVGMLQWNRLEKIVQQGYDHAVEVLDATPP